MKNLKFKMKTNIMSLKFRDIFSVSPVWGLVVATPIFLITLFLFRTSSGWQLRIILLTTAIYLGAALLHHKKDKSLTAEIVIEYILIVVLALVIIQGLLF